MNPVKLGVVGCGVIGPTHMAAAVSSPLLELVAVADLIDERAQAAASKYGAAKVYREGADLIADLDIEAVVLAFPAKGRTELGLLALANGKHLLTEKPVAMNAHEVKQLIAAQGDLKAACCSSRYRFVEGDGVHLEWRAGRAAHGPCPPPVPLHRATYRAPPRVAPEEAPQRRRVPLQLGLL